MSDIPGIWILLTTVITVAAPLLTRFIEKYFFFIIDNFSNSSLNIQKKWKSSVQLISVTIYTNFSSRSSMNKAYKAVMYRLIMNRNPDLPLNHVRQTTINDDNYEHSGSNEFLNRDLDFLATGYNEKIILDEATETYVIPSFEQETMAREAGTSKINVLNVVSNKISTTEMLNLISSYQVQYIDYIKRYNKDGKLKYIKLKPFIKEYSSLNDATKDSTVSVKRLPSWNITEFNSSKSFLNVFFAQKEQVINQIDNFIKGEDFYRQRGIPWNLSILLHGVPGCGKTSFIKALANKTNRHLLDINLTNIVTTQDFNLAFNTEIFFDTFIPIDKRIIVLEDIDCMNSSILNNRAKVNDHIKQEEDSMNLSCFLNMLDGIYEHHGRILVATTNHVDHLDPAVLRRFNVKVNFTHLTTDIAQQILQNYYNNNITLSQIPDNLTGAVLTQKCMMYQDDPEALIQSLKI